MPASTDSAPVFGWDIGGAHVKACRLQRGQVTDVAQWACPLWQGLEHLDQALAAAQTRWPDLAHASSVVTMTGEMVDLFSDREDGVQRIAERLAQRLPGGALSFFAGDAGWCGPADVATHWAAVASANWLATARHAALAHPDDAGVLVDIGSTTTDLIAFRHGRVLTTARNDHQRLARGELVYQGVVRTPLCALAPRVAWRGEQINVMNEYFATVADVYRLTGELDAAHDLYPPADSAGKDLPATRQRLARMIGLDARDATPAEWLACALAWRAAQVAELAGQLRRVMDAHTLGSGARVVSAGCGDFLVPDMLVQAAASRARCLPYASTVARLAPQADTASESTLRNWTQVCAPCVAVAALWEREQH